MLGFGAALRRSELVALDVEDLRFDAARGLLVTIRRSKADQEQEGAQVAVPYAQQPDRYAVRALRRYLDAAGIQTLDNVYYVKLPAKKAFWEA